MDAGAERSIVLFFYSGIYVGVLMPKKTTAQAVEYEYPREHRGLDYKEFYNRENMCLA